jgi:hypothetical protein
MPLTAPGTAQTSGQNVAAAWEAYTPQDPVDNIFPRHAILEELRSNGSWEEQHGTVIRSNIEWAQNPNVKWMSELETLTVSRPDTFDNCEYSWKFIGCDVPMTDFERGITSGGAKKFDLESRKIENMKNSVEDSINLAMFGDGTSFSSKSVGGLKLLCPSDPTTGSVGLINRATYSFWRSQTKDGTKNSVKFDNLVASMTNVYNSCSNGVGSQNPTFAIGTQTNFEGYEGTIQALERIDRTSTNDKGLRAYKGQNIMFKDIPFVYDPACTASSIYILNNRNLRIVYMQYMKGEAAIRPTDGFFDVFKVLTICNLITDNSRRLGVVFNTES